MVQTVPLPRSLSAILGGMMDTLLSRLGLTAMQPGDPSLDFLEASAQSDLRSSNDIFAMLASIALDRARGLALDRIGADEDVPRQGELPSFGVLTATDSSFVKISSKIFQGANPPIVGSTTLNVENAASFPTSGSIYIGRTTIHYEGPIAYSSKVNNGIYWTLNLSSPTQQYHNLGETVVLAQGGDRNIPAGQLAQTPAGNVGTSVQFRTLFSSTIPDGENTITGISATAQVPGPVGNVGPNSITEWINPPFSGAGVTNPSLFSNGLPTQDDDTYREAIRAARQSRSKGTATAIKTGISGVTSLDENKRVISSSIVIRENFPAVLYIDDGTGYEEHSEGVAYEVVVDSATGGEEYLSLANGRPVTKSFLETSLTAPFAITPGSMLAVLVGGQLSEHVFNASDFRNSSNASGYEVSASINGDPACLFSARTLNSGQNVAIFAKTDENEDIQIVAPENGFVDANLNLGFADTKNYSLFLYKNDRLLNKDGQLATITSKAQSLWGTISDGDTLTLSIDGISLPSSITTIHNTDFVNAGTTYSTVSKNNSLTSWAQVLNYKLPGITAAVEGGAITLTSNSGRSVRAHVTVSGGTMGVAMFGDLDSAGSSSDYTLDRNLGLIHLNTILSAGDKLTAGSLIGNAFIESGDFTAMTINTDVTNDPGNPTAGAELWVVVDGTPETISTGIGPGTIITIALNASPSWGNRVRISHASVAIWANTQIGDWVVIQDPIVNVNNRGAFRVANVDPSGLYIDVERSSVWASAQAGITLTLGAIKVIRTDTEPQRVLVVAGTNYTPTSISALFNSQVRGATAVPFRTSRFRLYSNSIGRGDISVVSTNSEGLKLLSVSSYTSDVPHLATVIAGHSALGTPNFFDNSIASVASSTVFTANASFSIDDSGRYIVGLRALPDSGPIQRYSNKNHVSVVDHITTSTTATLRTAVLEQWLPSDRFYMASGYSISPRDQLGLVVDGDEIQHRYVFNMFRRLKANSSTYGITNTFLDGDNSSLTLVNSFGLNFNWVDFGVYMQARTKTHSGPDTTKTGLWRYYRHGPEGNTARLAYGYPIAPNNPVAVTLNDSESVFTDITIALPAGPARTGQTFRNSSYIGTATVAGPVGGLYTYIEVYNLLVSSAVRKTQLNYSFSNGNFPVGLITGGTSGATATVVSDTNPGPGGATSGTLVISGITGTFINGETITEGAVSATLTKIPYGNVTLTLTMPPSITNHGLATGEVIYLKSNDIHYSSGAKIITNTSATTIDYTDITLSAFGPTANIGTVSVDVQGEVTLAGSTVVTGDIVNISSNSHAPLQIIQPLRIQTLSGSGDYVEAQNPFGGPISSTLQWYALVDASYIQFYPIGASNSILQIVTAVNALTNCAISGVAVGTGGVNNGVISSASYEATELGGTSPWYVLTDGYNWVRSQTNPVLITDNYSFTFKNDISNANLATNSDWLNEDVRIAPVTAQNVVDWLNSPGVGGLFSATTMAAAVEGFVPQITSLTVGSAGSVQINDGSANEVVASIVGSASVADTTSVVSIDTAASSGLVGDAWVVVENGSVAPKATIDSNTKLSSFNSSGVVQFDNTGTKAWNWATSTPGAIDDLAWQFEKQGDFVAVVFVGGGGTPSLAGIKEGDWTILGTTSTPPSPWPSIDTLNSGQFRVVRVNDAETTFWIENSAAVEQIGGAKLRFLTYDSVMPGDELLLNTSLWDINNIGTWKVASISSSDKWQFTLDTSSRTPVTFIPGIVTTLGNSYTLIKIIEGTPTRLIKKLIGICPNPTNADLTDLKFNTSASIATMSESFGTIIRSLDKLHFGLDINGAALPVATGVDGYQHSVGLIAEVNKVLYGDESDPTSYPGIAAVGARINESGPLVRRIQVSLGLRATETGIEHDDIESNVRAAVAAIVNSTPVGKSIGISKLISAAESVNGVDSVTWISPTYSVGNDLIPIQPFEKPMMLNLDDDIQISWVGE